MPLRYLRVMGKELIQALLYGKIMPQDDTHSLDVTSPTALAECAAPQSDVAEEEGLQGVESCLSEVNIRLDVQESTLFASQAELVPLDQENARLRATLAHVRNANDSLRDKGQVSREETKVLTDRVSQLEAERKFLAESLDASKAANQRLREVALTARDQRKTASDMLAAVEERCCQLEAGARKDEQSLLSIRNQLSDATRTLEDSCQKRRETEALLDIRTAELRDAQAALGAPTSHSHGDVQRLVDQLNAEVYQLSALVTDQLPFITKQSIWHGQSHDEEYGQVCSAVGNGLAHALSNCSHDDDPILVQIAVQAYLVERVACIVRAWSLFAEPEYCAVLDRLHTQIFEGESQTVSSGWRLLTRRYMSQADNVDNPIANVLCNFIISGVVAILALAGSPHTTENLRSKIHQAFGGKVGAIVTLAIELRVVIGEEMTSSEFLLLCPKYNVPFGQDFMEDADGEGSRDQCRRSSQGQPILGTVELGLCRYEKKLTENAIENVERRVLTKAKVVLCAMTEELVRRHQQGAANSYVQPSPRDSGGSTTPQENLTRFTFGSLQPAPGDKSSVW